MSGSVKRYLIPAWIVVDSETTPLLPIENWQPTKPIPPKPVHCSLFTVFYPDGVAATVTGRATSDGRTSSVGQI